MPLSYNETMISYILKIEFYKLIIEFFKEYTLNQKSFFI